VVVVVCCRLRSASKPQQPHFSSHLPLFVLAQHRSLRVVLSVPGLIVRWLEPLCQNSGLGSVGLASRVDLCAEVGSGGAGLGEVAGEDGLEERAEDDLGATTRC
jgi:hypothetical protein